MSPPSVEIEGGPRDENSAEPGHDDDLGHDSDSQYTYESYSDDDEPKKRRGWFGGLFGRRQSHYDESEEEYSEEDEEGEDSNMGEGKSKENVEDDETPASRKEGAVDEVGNPTSSSCTGGIEELAACHGEEEDMSEDKLMAEAISRVQNRIAANNGNLYNSLEPADKKLVDELKGVTDTKEIEKAVEESLNIIEDEKVETSVKIGERAHETDRPKGVGADEKDEQSTAEIPKADAAAGPLDVGTPESPTDPDRTDAAVYAESTVRGAAAVDEPSDAETKIADEECSDEDEEPTLNEKRSLLSLAAEHDRVDVIKDLLSDSNDVETLLTGTSSHRDDDGEDFLFIPPPLHIAVAHGSANATACLLRMNADPSLRPTVPSRFLSSSYTASKKISRSNSGMSIEEDRNYKKYHELTAWELAFGGMRVIKDDGDDEAAIAHGAAEESEPNQSRSWFGFGTPTKAENEIIVTTETASDGTTRVMKISPLNIPQTKLEGIKHAFATEALRCIGSNEVARLRQLLDAGMEPSTHVMADKDFREWALEVDAKDCVDLLDLMAGTDDEPVPETDPFVDGRELSVEDTDAPRPAVEAHIDDERLAGLSAGDMAILIQENSNLIPALQSCHDDLLAETTLCKAILKDVSATGGRGGLSSQSLLDLVRQLKDQRQQINDSTSSWQAAWEEREDELDFFWEEVLDEELRDELGASLGQVKDPTDMRNVAVESGSIHSLARQFIEVDDRVNSLRELIGKLAEESTRLAKEIDSNGMSGALKLTRSLKQEITDAEKELRVAQSGESTCRAKLELIQRRLGHDQGEGEGTEEDFDQPEFHQPHETSAVVPHDDMLDDHFVEPSMHESSQESIQHVDEYQEPRPEGDYDESDDEDYVVDDESSSDDDYTEGEYTDEEEELEEEQYVVVSKENVMANLTLVATETSRQDAEVEENPPDEQPLSDEVGEHSEPPLHLPKETVSDQIDRSQNKSDDPVVPAEFVHLPEQAPVAEVKPSEKIAKGVSTAIIAHSSSSIPISSQIWEILRRIVGLSSSARRSSSFLEAENNPTIMIV